MAIEGAVSSDFNAVFALLSRCRNWLLEQGISQWDTDYPTRACVEKDILKGSLAKLTHKDQLLD